MRFGYHPHAVRVRLDKVAAGMKFFPVTTTGAGGLPLQPTILAGGIKEFHGVHGVPNSMDGVPGVTQAPIKPGQTSHTSSPRTRWAWGCTAPTTTPSSSSPPA
jgi:hypothetical protein